MVYLIIYMILRIASWVCPEFSLIMCTRIYCALGPLVQYYDKHSVKYFDLSPENVIILYV